MTGNQRAGLQMEGSPAPAGLTTDPRDEGDPAPVALAPLVRSAVRDEFDQVLPHLLAALKRDRAFDDMAKRLRDAEARLDARRERPIAVALLALLHRVRHLQLDPVIQDSLDSELVTILRAAGFEQIGVAGERFDPDRHDALEGRTAGGAGTVDTVFATGLISYGDVVARAQVRVVPAIEDVHQEDERK
jgi:hypothetical protein